ncbi:hypothetical protein KEG38_18165 [Polyangium jinanense]|uniref:hypothetical protein n=1 Tax=Polyangium jinanense TaxID=2829994 RepID=UPI002340117F|nr:hypothetical protein [Polyangium jinanense]MDC3955796.1 hypothetical protein [Polyangium jinanense]
MTDADKVADFYSGAQMLQFVAAWAYVVANRERVLELLDAFEKAYEQMIPLHAAGKIYAGDAEFTAENLDRVKRIRLLLQPGLDSREAMQAAPEILALAERCWKGLTGKDVFPLGQEE